MKWFLVLSILFSTYASMASVPKVRVRIAKSLKSILVSGIDLKRLLHFNNDFKHYSGKKTIKFNCASYYSLNRERNRPELLATLSSNTGLLSFDHEKFRGDFKVITSPKGDSCDVVNETNMEDYLSTVLAKEMNGKWPIEALKAQAVAARTYALQKMESKQVSKILGNESHYDLESSEKHQVGGNFFDVTQNTLDATFETKGEVLLPQSGKLEPIYFHAKCGGRTLRPDQVWNQFEEGYASVNCPFCHGMGSKGYRSIISQDKLRSFLLWAQENKHLKRPIRLNGMSEIRLVPDEFDRFQLSFYVDDQLVLVNKALLRRYFGNQMFQSNFYSLRSVNNHFMVEGEGLGHGVGLCQMGALAMAQRGWDYRRILQHYFPGHTIKKIY